MSYITAIGTANPKHRFSQAEIAAFMLRAMQLNPGDDRKLKTIFRATGIEYRHTVLEDYGRTANFTFFPQNNTEPYPSTQDRLTIFRSNILELSTRAVANMIVNASRYRPADISHLIIVCCTGMYAPGLDIEMIHALGLRTTVKRTAITFMGCYAAFNALKVADAFCKSERDAKVLIVCAELCSLHFQQEPTEDNLLANALFADGAAAVLVENNPAQGLKLKLSSFHNDLAPEGASDMAWSIGNLGFEMKLSAYVPGIIKQGIARLTRDLLDKISANLNDIKHFAIHPGGRKILEVIEQELGITQANNAAAYHVLKNYGNMSSPTILFVLAEIIRNLSASNKNERILSFAFGPGLTLESMILEIENL